MEKTELLGVILDADYVLNEGRGTIRLSFKTKDDNYDLFDPSFFPYFYLLPSNDKLDAVSLKGISIWTDNNEEVKPKSVEEGKRLVGTKERKVYKIFVESPRNVPKMKEAFAEFGTCYEHDIVFWKRYLIDKQLSPLQQTRVVVHKESERYVIDSIEGLGKTSEIKLKALSFDIETYNPLGIPNEDKDPVIMISYTDGNEGHVLTTKKIDKPFVKVFKGEKEMIKAFIDVIIRLDPDIIAGYSSSNFDIPYLIKRANKNKMEFAIGRHGEEPKKEHHGLIDAIKISGRIHMDVYHVARFVSAVGASEKVIKVNNFKLYEVYHAITGKEKKMVDKGDIWEQWDAGGEILANLAEYSLADSLALHELYEFFLPIEVEVASVSGTTLGESSISTTSQLVEYMLMRYAYRYNQMIPNKPDSHEIDVRAANPYVGAFVKTPDAGIYDNIVVFDFRGLYPSIIITYNIDLATICSDCTEYYESPDDVKFRKDVIGIMPMLLKILIEERYEVKKAFKKSPDSKSLGARSTALKIIANAFYGYLGYARSRWYSRECASSVTSFGRLYISETIEKAEKAGFRVLYADTDSIFMLKGDKNKEDANKFLNEVNKNLPKPMEMELEDYYTRGVFVGKRGGEVGAGAKKKYAMLSEGGRIKIKGFELVRRDWSKVARDTQLAVLEAILKEGSKEKAVSIVKDVVDKLKSGKMELKDLVIHTQLRKGIRNYDIKSPELAAAKKAIERGVKRRDELEGAAIGYVITKHGNSISEKAEIDETAKDYDPDYYIDHQVIPATLKILKELGYNADELRNKGSQKKLGG